MRILIIDDNPLDGRLVGELCRRRWPDAHLVAEATGAAALERLSRESYDVVLLDYVLPDMNGLTWLKRAGPLKHKSPIVMLTWYGDEKIAATAILKGAAAYVPKEDVADLLTVSIEQVTRHRRAVRRIKELRLRLHHQSQHRRNVIESVPMVLYTTDRQLRITQINQAFREAARNHGAPQLADDDRVLGRRLPEFIADGPVRAFYERVMQRVLVGGEAHQEQIASHGADGGLHCHLTISPLVCCDSIDGLIFCCQNTTDRVQKLRFEVQALRLEENNRRLRDTDAFKTQFLANVSHDLRTPLTAIMAYCEMSKDFAELTRDQQQSNLAIIHEQADRLNQMIGNLLDLSQMEARQHQWSPLPVRPEEVASKVCQALTPTARTAGLELVLHAEPDVPVVRADADGMERVLTNLVGNALKFTAKGGVEVRIQRWRHQAPLAERMVWGDRPAVLITVEDSGHGMQPEECRVLFGQPEQYRRERKGQGFGLGLAICQQIIRQHGGRIWATSQPGEGSRFHTLWPVEPVGRAFSGPPTLVIDPAELTPGQGETVHAD